MNTCEDVADGLFWAQQGGNGFVARNAVTNNGLEGLAINSGPTAAVQNQIKTWISLGATCGFDTFGGYNGVNGGTTEVVYSIVGNSMEGGRNFQSDQSAESAAFAQSLHVCGNRASVFPAFERYDDIAGNLFRSGWSGFANISGNTLASGGCGVLWLDNSTNALVLKNDFGAATHRALDYYGTNGPVQTVQIYKNVLNQGTSYHLKLRASHDYGFFLWRNTYTNGVSSVKPFVDAEHSPVHFGN